eukprot:1158679-Pelagomonas_calceolata.AAC.5
MKFASKSNGTIMVKFQFLKLVQGMFSVIDPTDTQKDDLHAAVVLSPTVDRPSIFTTFNLYQVYVPLVHTQLMGLSNAGGCVGPVLCLLRDTWCEEEEEEEEEEGLESMWGALPTRLVIDDSLGEGIVG